MSAKKEPKDDEPLPGEATAAHKYKSPEPKDLTVLRRKIEAGNYDEVEEMIQSNPKYLVTVCDSAVYLMAGPKYNACHIAARANRPEIMALILETVGNVEFLRKLYPDQPDQNVRDRLNHLLDSYLNTPDPRGGNTPLHFACKKGYHQVVRVLLSHENLHRNLKDSAGRKAEETICEQAADSGDAGELLKKKIKDMFKRPLHLPLHRDQLKKKLILERRRSQAGLDSSFDISADFSLLSLGSPAKRDLNDTHNL